MSAVLLSTVSLYFPVAAMNSTFQYVRYSINIYYGFPIDYTATDRCKGYYLARRRFAAGCHSVSPYTVVYPIITPTGCGGTINYCTYVQYSEVCKSETT